VLSGEWILKNKLHPDGSLERRKARWVLRGDTQRSGVDFDQTFSPVVDPATIRTVLTLAASYGWLIHQLDVSNAFFHDKLKETVYCQQPTGFVDSEHPDYLCLLSKCLYGLRQAPRPWYSSFAAHLRSLGFVTQQAPTHRYLCSTVAPRWLGSSTSTTLSSRCHPQLSFNKSSPPCAPRSP
jgi:hypothetical protein